MAQLTKYWIADFVDRGLYDDILSVCAEKCPTLSLTIQRRCGCSENLSAFLQDAKPFIFRDGQQEWWPAGGTVFPYTQRVIHLNVCVDSLALLRRVSSGLYDWLQPFLPEDLAFYRPDNRPYLGIIAHEQWAYFALTQEELDELKRRLPTLVLSDRPPEHPDEEYEIE